MIYSSAMVLNVGKYSCQAKSVSTSCQANIVFLYTTNICLLEVHYFLKVEMKYFQTRLYETKKSLGAPIFGFQWTLIFTFVRVSIPFTVSLIFQMFPWVARGVCDFRRQLKFKLIYSPLLAARWRMGIATVTVIWVSPGVTVQFFFFTHVCWNTFPSLYFKPSRIFQRHFKVCLCDLLLICVNTVLQLNLWVWSKLNKSVTKHLVPSGMSV